MRVPGGTPLVPRLCGSGRSTRDEGTMNASHAAWKGFAPVLDIKRYRGRFAHAWIPIMVLHVLSKMEVRSYGAELVLTSET